MEAPPLPVPESGVTDGALEKIPAGPEPTNGTREKKDALISFRHVSFAYGDGPRVLHDINLDILPGDLVAILGPNGAGKSTLVKHAIGLLKPVEGQVLVGGRDTGKASVAQTARSVGYVFQSPSHMLFAPTVREELAFGPNNLRFSEQEVKGSVQAAIRAVNLGGLEEFAPLGLSFGQQKRTTIGAVVAMRSRVLVMDEPTAGQDFANYTRFMESLVGTGLQEDDKNVDGRPSALAANFDATLFITHDVDLAVTYANRVILLRDGRIAADGLPQAVLCDFDLLESCRVLPTSLLRLNCKLFPKTGRFLPAEMLGSFSQTR
jgi:energy-coupling factor transport system ATP-binding protein